MTLATTIARALRASGVTLATHVPGHGATHTFEAFRALCESEQPVSFHEEPAYQIAHGAALAGRRAACIMKSHGLTKSLNAVTDSLSCGVTAGMITIIFEDKTGAHSDNIIEIVPLIEGAEMPYRRGQPSSAYSDIRDLVELSERHELPFAIVFDSADIELDVPEAPAVHSLTPSPGYERDPLKHVVCPVLAPYQREVLVEKLRREDWRAVARPELPVIPSSLPPAYQKAVEPYLPIFKAFSEMGVDFVCGDAGVSTLSAFPPYNIVHAALYMGGSIPCAIGAYLAGLTRAWSFIGDFSFIAAGHYGLVEAVLRKTPIKVLLYANGRAETTGGQPLELALMERLLAGYSEFVRRIPDPTNLDHVRSVLTEANDANELRIVVAEFAR